MSHVDYDDRKLDELSHEKEALLNRHGMEDSPLINTVYALFTPFDRTYCPGILDAIFARIAEQFSHVSAYYLDSTSTYVAIEMLRRSMLTATEQERFTDRLETVRSTYGELFWVVLFSGVLTGRYEVVDKVIDVDFFELTENGELTFKVCSLLWEYITTEQNLPFVWWVGLNINTGGERE